LYYKKAKGAVVVYDVTQASSMERAKDWIEELNENAEPDVVIALVGNKCDLAEFRQIQAEVLYLPPI
jgi:Ras-related protein Rab-5C